MKKNQLFALLLICCPLLMANSPAPRPSYDDYFDINVTGELVSSYNGKYTYIVSIQNVGELHSFYQVFGRQNDQYLNVYDYAILEPISTNQMIAPGKTGKMTVIFEEEVSDFSQYEFYSMAYSIPDTNVTFSNLKITKKS